MPQWHSIKNLAYLKEATICSYSESILVLSNGECDLHPQEHPIVDQDLRLDDFQSFEYGILDLVGIGHGLLGNLFFFFAFLLQLVSRFIFFVSRLFPISMSMRSSLLDDILRDWKEGPSYL